MSTKRAARKLAPVKAPVEPGTLYDVRAAHDATPAMIWTATAEGRVDYFNQRSREYLGLGSHEPLSQAVHHDDLARVRAAWLEAVKNASNYEIEARGRLADGTYHWMLHRAEPIRDAGGAVVQWFGTSIDIDQQKRVEAELAASELRYRVLAEALPDVVWTARPDGYCDYFNSRWSEFTGLSLEESVGDGWARAIHPDDVASTLAIWQEAVQSRKRFELETRFRRVSDHSYRWQLGRGVPMLDAGGSVVRWFGTCTDIDDRRRTADAMEFLAHTGDALASSLDLESMLRDVARLAVPAVAECCAVFLSTRGEGPELVAVTHQDPALQAFFVEVARGFPMRRDGALWRALEEGEPLMLGSIRSAHLHRIAHDERHFSALSRLRMRSAIVVPLRLRDETVGALALINAPSERRYDSADLRVATLLAKRVASAVDNARVYERERRVADTFQRAALPKMLPQVNEIHLNAVYAAAEVEAQVGGDWYDAFMLDDGRLVVSIGDVSGKGLDAAVLMSNVRQAVRVAALQGLDPAATLSAADAALQRESPGRIVSAFVAVIDPRHWMLSYASAGHPPPFLRRPDGTLMQLSEIAPPLGVLKERPALRHVVGVPAGSLLVLYTDGLIESTHDVLEGIARLEQALGNDAVVHASDPAQLLHDMVLYDGVRDDVAILTVALGRNAFWTFESIDAMSAQSARSSFVEYLAMHGEPGDDFSSAEVIFGELTGNVARYAPGRIDIDVDWNDVSPILHVLDRGPHFDLKAALPEDVMSERGRGLFIVSVMGSNLRVDALPGRGNHVSVVLPVRRKQVSEAR